MPSPIRDDGRPGPDRHLLVLVHGFASSPSCWDELCSILAEDPRFASHDVVRYEYPTQILPARPWQRIPRLQELVSGFAGFMDDKFGDTSGDRYIDITLAGHSQGGLVILGYLVRELREKHGHRLQQIRQVSLFATPSLGSGFAGNARKAFTTLFGNPQEKLLREFEPEIADLREAMTNRVITATERLPEKCPIPVHAFWGLSDGIVTEASARAICTSSQALPGDHSMLIRPAGSTDPAYQLISSALLEPHGHPHVYQIEEFLSFAEIAPLPSGEPYLAHYGGRQRAILTDNVAHLYRSVTFGPRNQCSDLFTLKYATRNDGFVNPRFSHPNAAPDGLQREWEDRGTQALFQFRPEPAGSYNLALDVYKGFDRGSRDIHYHLASNAFIRRFVCQLDLRAYLRAGFAIQIEPSLCFLRHDPGHSSLCFEREHTYPDPPTSYNDGVWRWELEHLRQGVVDLRWELNK